MSDSNTGGSSFGIHYKQQTNFKVHEFPSSGERWLNTVPTPPSPVMPPPQKKKKRDKKKKEKSAKGTSVLSVHVCNHAAGPRL